MDRTQADRLQAFFFKVVASWEAHSEAKRLEAFHPRGLLTGPGGEPDALLVQTDSGRHFRVPLTEEGEGGFVFADCENFEPVEFTVVRKSEAVAMRQAAASAAKKADDKPEVADPVKPGHSIAASVEEIQQNYSARRRAEAAAYDKVLDARIAAQKVREDEAAANPPPDPFKATPRERIKDADYTIQAEAARRRRRERGE